MRLGPALEDAARSLGAAGVEAPRREARLLAAHVLGLPAGSLPPADTEIDADSMGAVVARRAMREPLALIVGHRGFWTLDLAVSAETLIPRPESETLIEAAIAAFPDRATVTRVLDLGTGTGCLLLAALCEFPGAFGIGTDIAPAAAWLAAENARACGLAPRAAFVASDWASAISRRFDLVLCNPPYIRAGELAALMPEVRLYEPARALDGGADGLDAYRAVLRQMPALLEKHGVAVLELGEGQADAVAALAAEVGLTHLHTRRDLAGIPRALVAGAGRGL
jgi:release factor glutamine methyltransferase